jgi:hypothetical protein
MLLLSGAAYNSDTAAWAEEDRTQTAGRQMTQLHTGPGTMCSCIKDKAGM